MPIKHTILFELLYSIVYNTIFDGKKILDNLIIKTANILLNLETMNKKFEIIYYILDGFVLPNREFYTFAL